MEISLNNQTVLLNDGLTIEKLLNHINIQHKYFAVEVNEQIIPKSNHKLFIIKDGDKIEIVTAIGGG
jgi:sulfur carrier protein